MRRREAHRILTSRGWLAEIDPALASAVIEAGRLVEFDRGEALYQPGDGPGGMYGVVSGGILLSAFARNGLPVAGHIARRCTWFGFGSVLDRHRRVLIPTANEASLVLNVPLGELERLRDTFPTAGRAFGQLAMWSDAISLTIISDLLIANTDRRVAAVLLRVTGAELPDRPREMPSDGPRDRPSGPAADGLAEPLAEPWADPLADPWAETWASPDGVPLTQAMLAELANASPHTVARFVERAGKAGMIEWKYGRVRILDAGELAAFAAG
jgi:CRP-like cAMP-binding protein